MDRELLRIERLPVLQNRTHATAEEARSSPVGDFVLVQDAATGLIANRAFDPALLVYDADYQNEQAHSAVFRTHLDDVAAIVERWLGRTDLLEIGCGKGYFLEHLRDRGASIVGVDPAYEGADPAIVKAPFSRSLGLTGSGLVLRHVLEHIPDPLAFLAEILAANGRDARIYIEVPCFDWILARRAWFDLFYEHVNYFRPVDLHAMFARVHEIGHLFGGQYMYVVADLASLRVPRATASAPLELPADFLGGIERAAAAVASDARGNALWGAASKGVIFALHLERRGVALDCAIDINPAKQGRYLPVTALHVLDPVAACARMRSGDRVFVMNSNYLDEIVATSGARFEYIAVDAAGATDAQHPGRAAR